MWSTVHPYRWVRDMNRKNTILMAGAVAAGMQAASQKSQNPSLTMLLVFTAVALSYFADPPRDPASHDRKTDVTEPAAPADEK